MSDAPWSDLITTERILELHAEGIRRYGGAGEGPATAEGCVEGSLGNAWTAALYREPEEALQGLSFATHLLAYLARDHCFTDGNKRVAWLACMDILGKRRLTLLASADEAEAFMTSIIVDDLASDQVADWIAVRLVWIQ